MCRAAGRMNDLIDEDRRTRTTRQTPTRRRRKKTRAQHARTEVSFVARRKTNAQTLTGSVSSPVVSKRALTAKEKEKEKEGTKKRRHERGRDRLWKRE